MTLKDLGGWIFLAVALLVGGLAYWLAQRYLAGEEDRLRLEMMGGREEQAQVVVARRDLKPGEVIDASSMALGKMPREHVSARAVLPESFEQIQGRVVTQTMSSGEPLLANYVAGLYVERFADLLAEGERAVSLEVSALETHSGLLVPGDFIDLFVLVEGAQGKGKGRALVPVLDRVRILAAGPAPLRAPDQRYLPLEQEAQDYSAITVGVKTDDAQRLLLARDLGRMTYLLRNPADASVAGRPAPPRWNGYQYVSASQPQGAARAAIPLNGAAQREPLDAIGQHRVAAADLPAEAAPAVNVLNAEAR